MAYSRQLLSILALVIIFFTVSSSYGQHVSEDGLLFFPPQLTGKLVAPITLSDMWESTETQHILARQVRLKKSLPFLPIIFFDNPGQTDIPRRYQKLHSSDTRRFIDLIEVPYNESAIEVYRQILNIVGYRMNGATLYLTGCYSADVGENKEVAQQRAENVKSYLTAIWGIKPARIILREPQLLGKTTDSERQREEGRAVWMEFDHSDVVGPIDYTVVHNRSLSIPIELELQTHLNSEEVLGFEIDAWLDHHYIGQRTLPKEVDSAIYRFRGEWSIPSSVLSTIPSRFQVQVRIVKLDGQRRLSNILSFPVDRQKRKSKETSRLYYMLWNIVPMSMYQIQNMKLKLTTQFDEVIRQTSNKDLNLQVSVPRGVTTDESWRGIVANMRGSVHDVDMKVYDVTVVEEKNETVEAGIESHRSCDFSFRETGKKQRILHHNRDELNTILALDQELQSIFPLQIEDNPVSKKIGEIVIQRLQDVIKEMPKKESNNVIVPRRLSHVEVIGWEPIRLFSCSTPEERCYNRSVKVDVW